MYTALYYALLYAGEGGIPISFKKVGKALQCHYTIRYVLFQSGEFNLISLVTLFNDSIFTRLSEIDYEGFLDTVSRRLQMFDYLNVFYNHNPINDYLGINYGLKTFWNVIYPNLYSGLTFSDASIFQSNLFKVSYGHGTYEEAVLNYHSDMLPLFGVLYINFGSISFVILTILGFIFSIIYRW